MLLIAATVGLWAEKTQLGARVSGAVIAILFTFILSNLGMIPISAPVYDLVWTYLVPLAIPLLLFKADLRKILSEAGPTLVAFFAGAVGTVLGVIVAYRLLSFGEQNWKLAGVFTATYIGGSMNFVAAAKAVDLQDEGLLVAGTAADNLVMTVFFLILFALPSVRLISSLFKPNETLIESAVREVVFGRTGELRLTDIGAGLALSFLICAAGFQLESILGLRGSGILVITALAVTLATVFPDPMGKITGAHEVGNLFMQIFFAAIGASANFAVVLREGPVLFVFVFVVLTIHLLVILVAGKLFGLRLSEVLIASNANMGGPTTAAAMAIAKRWDHLIIPAILCGTLGYATATFIGVAVGTWFK